MPPPNNEAAATLGAQRWGPQGDPLFYCVHSLLQQRPKQLVPIVAKLEPAMPPESKVEPSSKYTYPEDEAVETAVCVDEQPVAHPHLMSS